LQGGGLMITKAEQAAFEKRAKASALKRQRRVLRVFRALRRVAKTMPPRDKNRSVLEAASLELERHYSDLVNYEDSMDTIHRAAAAIKAGHSKRPHS
jgi:hypothetical protein